MVSAPELFSTVYTDSKILHDTGRAKIYPGTLIAPIFHRLAFSNDRSAEVFIDVLRATTDAYEVRASNVFQYNPQIRFDCTDPQLDGKPSGEFFSRVNPDEYWTVVRLTVERMERIQGRVYLGFLLFVGDLRPY